MVTRINKRPYSGYLKNYTSNKLSENAKETK